MRFWWAALARSAHFRTLGEVSPYQPCPALKSILYSLVIFLKVHSRGTFQQHHRGHRVPSKHHPCGCGSLHLFFAELWNGLQSLELNRVSCITNAHLFPSAHFREYLCLLLACLATMKPNKVGLGQTSWDHLIHYPFPKAYRVNNGTASLQTPAARLWKFGFS